MELGIEEAGGYAVVAVELDVIERGGYAEPAGHSGGFHAAHMRLRADNHVAAAHGTADEDDLEFDSCAYRKCFWTEEEAAGGADVASDQRDGKVFRDILDAVEAQWKLQGGAGVLTLLRENTDGMGGDANEAASVIFGKQRRDTQSWDAWRRRRDDRTRSKRGGSGLRGSLG